MSSGNLFKLTVEQETKLVELYNSGKSLIYLANLFNVSRPTISNFLKKKNIKVRTRQETRILNMPSDYDIVNYYINSKNKQDVFKKFHIGEITLMKILRRNNIKPRTLQEAVEAVKKYKFNYNYFEKIDTPDKAYFLGLLITDGNIINNAVRIVLQGRDNKILNKFCKVLDYTGEVQYFKHPGSINPYCRLALSNKKICEDLAKLGCIPNKTHKTYFPPIGEKYWNHFIRGVFDGDGCIFVGKEYSQVSFSIVGNILLLEKIQEILIKECGLNKTKLQINTKDGPENIVVLSYSGRYQAIRIRDYLYKNCEDYYIERKKEKFDNIPITNPNSVIKTCCVCGGKHFAKGLCNKHYNKKWRDKKKNLTYKMI